MWGKRRMYLDWASAAPVSPSAHRAFARALTAYGNPGAPHDEGRRAKELLSDARRAIAREAGTKPESIIFTSGATEANNLVILGALRVREQGAHVLYQPGTHASLTGAIEELARRGAVVEALTLTDGALDLNRLAAQLRPETALVVTQAVCSETGARFDIRGVRRVLEKTGSRALLHTDASQLPLAESFEHTRLGADAIVLDAQKVGGVRGVGALVLPKRTDLAPLAYGGGQEEGLRPGTEPVALAAAFAAALVEVREKREAFVVRASDMRTRFVRTIANAVPDAVVNEGKENVAHIVNLSFPGRDSDYAVALLNARRFAVSTKSSCETDSADGSRAVLALTGDEARARVTLRVSWGPETHPRDLDRLAEELIRTIRFLDGAAV